MTTRGKRNFKMLQLVQVINKIIFLEQTHPKRNCLIKAKLLTV